MNKISIFIILIVFLVSCSPVVLLTPAQSDVERVKSIFPNYTLAELNSGKELYEQKCGTCHSLKNPSKRNAGQWKLIVPDMSKKANKNIKNINDQQQELILKYLVTMCNAPLPNK